MGAGRKDIISSYNSSLSCSRLMSSLCTDTGHEIGTYFRRIRVLTIKLEELGIERGSNGFIVGIVLKDISKKKYRNENETYVCIEVWVSQCLLDGNPFLGIKCLQDTLKTSLTISIAQNIPKSWSKSRQPMGSHSGTTAQMVCVSGTAALGYNHVIDAS